MGFILPLYSALATILSNTFGQIQVSFLSDSVCEGELSMAAGSVVAFWGVALLLIMVPGADWAFVLGASLRGHSVLPAVGGLVLGYAGITTVVAVGVGAIVGRSPALLAGLTVAGGCYLIWHGATTFARSAAPPAAALPRAGTASAGTPSAGAAPAGTSSAGAAPAGTSSAGAAPAGIPPTGAGRAVLVRGMGVSALNPKGLLVFLALLPQFTNPHGSWPLAGQLGLLGLVFVLSCGAFYLGLGSVARKILAARPAAARGVTRFSGAAMVVIGALLLAVR
jgi:threonine/homoserine/homoserine lactone efflux protein